MIGYFRINDPYRLVGLFILLLVLYLPFALFGDTVTIPELRNLLLGEKLNEGFRMYQGVIDDTGPLAAWAHEVFDTLFGRSTAARHVLAFIVIFLQCAYVGLIFISRRVFTESTYVPSFLCGLLFLTSYDNFVLSNELMGSVFLLLGLHNLFREIEFRHESDEGILGVGLSISIASLFAFSFAVYIVAAIVILVLFTRSDARRFVLLIFSFLLPHLLTLSVYFVNGSTAAIWENFYLANLSFAGTALMDTRSLLTLAAVPIFYFVVSMIMLNRDARLSKYQSQILQATMIWLIVSVFFLLSARDLRPQSLIVFFPALSFLFTHFFLVIRRVRFIRINAWVFFLGIISISYLARFGKIHAVNYSTMWIDTSVDEFNGKRLLVLDKSIDAYYRNQLATPFLEWRLSEPIFRHPEYYENVTLVYEAFTNDPPEVVLDPHNLLAPFLRRMPQIEQAYTRRGTRYIRINN